MELINTMFPRQSAFRIFSQQLPRFSRISRPQCCNPAWRHFTSSVPRTKGPSPDKLTRPRPMGRELFDRTIAQLGNRELFRAPNHRLYLFGSYSLAILAFAMSGYNAHITFQDPLGPLPTWIKASSAVVSIIASFIGTMLILKTGRLVKSVHTVRHNNQAIVRIFVRRMIPFMKPLQIDAKPREVSITNQVVMAPEAIHARKVQQKSLQARPSWFKAPLKATNNLSWRIFKTARQIATEEDIITLKLDGQRGLFRMDGNGTVSKELGMFTSSTRGY